MAMGCDCGPPPWRIDANPRLGGFARPERFGPIQHVPTGSTIGGFVPPGLATAQAHAALQASPRLAAVLEAYVRHKLATGQPFRITDELNTEALRARGLGFFAEIAAALSSAIGSIGSVVGPAAQVAAAVHTIEGAGGGGGGGGSTVTADQIAAAILPQVQQKLAAQGVTLPSDVAHQAVAASVLDAFGPQYRPLVTAGLVVLGVALLVKVLRR